MPDTTGQRKKSRQTRIYYKSHYSRAPKAEKQCSLLIRRRQRSHNRRKSNFLEAIFGQPRPKSSSTSRAEVNDTPPPTPKTKVLAKKKPEPKKEQKLDERQENTNDVLEKNNLPKPTSAKHRQIRMKVEQRLKQLKEGESVTLDPLYFVYDDAEFAMVDMDPFLMAVEYALQGRMVLIEGHTDSHGKDNYNVQLSIQRVEKIRQLMHDLGVPDERISIVGYGEEIAEHDNTTEEGRQRNRRVDFKIF